ncbi:MAG: sigma-E factor negative regulatory protein [Gammaproteobacteria bacterium]|nr:sigma-E factor negative regulatory protein [Gammaproteobacteria bacterium]
MNDAIKMQISAFADGELPQNEAELLLRRLCQDRELRQQVAEYLAMGRAMRGERGIAGIENLRGRIAAALDDTTFQEEPDIISSARPRFLRPLAGVAIAASVALAALLGLQQVSRVADIDSTPANTAVAESVEDGAYTVPDQGEDQLRDYYLRHSATSSYFGVNSINARLVTLQLREGVIVDSQATELNAEDADEEAPEAVPANKP